MAPSAGPGRDKYDLAPPQNKICSLKNSHRSPSGNIKTEIKPLPALTAAAICASHNTPRHPGIYSKHLGTYFHLKLFAANYTNNENVLLLKMQLPACISRPQGHVRLCFTAPLIFGSPGMHYIIFKCTCRIDFNATAVSPFVTTDVRYLCPMWSRHIWRKVGQHLW